MVEIISDNKFDQSNNVIYRRDCNVNSSCNLRGNKVTIGVKNTLNSSVAHYSQSNKSAYTFLKFKKYVFLLAL